jgi:ubiquinone/menaquinone biosynthesis C-methylase UbiE
VKPDSQYIHGTEQAEQERLAALNRLTNPAFLEFLELRPDSVVLEVGSGLGILAGEVAARAPRGEVIGIEYSTEQLAAARVTVPNLHFEQGDAHRLPFDGARFDVVYCRYLLEHVADPVQVLREMRRVLRPGGRVCIQENNILANEFHPECPKFDAVWEKFAALQSKLDGDALIGKKLFAILRQAGFQHIRLSFAPEIHPADSDTFLPWVENMVHNVTGAAELLVLHRFATQGEIDDAVAEVRAFEKLPDACAYFYWNRACAW